MDTTMLSERRWRIVFAESKAERDALEEQILKQHGGFSKRHWCTWLWEGKKGLFVKKKTVGEALSEAFDPRYGKSLAKRGLDGFGCGSWYDKMCDQLSTHQRDIACQLSGIYNRKYFVFLRDDTDEDTVYSQKFLIWFFKDRDPATTQVIWLTHKPLEFLVQPMAPNNLTREYKIENEDYEGIRVADVFDGVYGMVDGQLKSLNAQKAVEMISQNQQIEFENMTLDLALPLGQNNMEAVFKIIAPMVQSRYVPALIWLADHLEGRAAYETRYQNLLHLLSYKYGYSKGTLLLAKHYEKSMAGITDKKTKVARAQLTYSYYLDAYKTSGSPEHLFYLARFCYCYEITDIKDGQIVYVLGPDQAIEYTVKLMAYRDTHPERAANCDYYLGYLQKLDADYYARARQQYKK